jgi:hypothetical protein
MDSLLKEFNEILKKYDFYNKIEPNLSWGDVMQFETLKEILEKKKINNLKIFVNGYGLDTIRNKIKSFFPDLIEDDEELKKFIKKIENL